MGRAPSHPKPRGNPVLCRVNPTATKYSPCAVTSPGLWEEALPGPGKEGIPCGASPWNEVFQGRKMPQSRYRMWQGQQMSHLLPKGTTRWNREQSRGSSWSSGGLSWACPSPGAAAPSHFPRHSHWEEVSDPCRGQEHEEPELGKENIPGIFSGSGSEGTSGSSNCSCKDIKHNMSQTTAVGWQCPTFPPRLSSDSRKKVF